MLFKRTRINSSVASSSRNGKAIPWLLLVTVGLAAAVAMVVPAGAKAVTPAQLAAHGWTCFLRPIGDGTVCANPGLGRPPLPPVADSRPSYMFLLFDSQGTFTATELLIRADLYRGQLCAGSGNPYVFRDRIGYYECVHP